MSEMQYDLSTARKNPYAQNLKKNGYYIKIFVPPEDERKLALESLEISNEELAMLKEIVAKEEARRGII